MRVCVLGSGSGGNSTLIESRGTAILIDAGLSGLRVRQEMRALGLVSQKIAAIFLTHEHADHCCEAGSLARRLGCPIYGTQGTLEALRWCLSGREELRPFSPGERLVVGSLELTSFPVFHDAAEPCGYLVRSEEGTVGLATDLGVMSRAALEALAACDAVILEANHDLEMLKTGPYPWELKQRIRSEVGHLSNDACGEALAELARSGRLRAAFLAHLSRTNNRPELALQTVQSYLDGRAELHLTWQDCRSELLIL